MAMIQCEECGQWISDRANACPHCGCPVSNDYYEQGYNTEYGRLNAKRDVINETRERNRKKYSQWRKTYIVVSVVMLYLAYIIGNDLATSNFGLALVGFVIIYGILTILGGVSFWQGVILHIAIPKLWGYMVIIICSCISYSIGFFKGLK